MQCLWILVSVLALTTCPNLLAQRGRGTGAPSASRTPQISTPTPRETTPNQNSNRSAHTVAPPATSSTPSVASRTNVSPALDSRIHPLLPAGVSSEAAAEGFSNQGQFLAALHVAHNLNIPFDQIKSEMTGSNPVALGKAIHALRPTLGKTSVKESVKEAEKQAERDLGSVMEPRSR